MNSNAIFGTDLDLAHVAEEAAAGDTTVQDVNDAPTTVPCGITISITLDC